MKKGFLFLLTIFSLTLVSCNLMSNNSFDNNNITEVEGLDGYYIDDALSFCAEIKGSYKSDRPFTLDPNNDNIRVWDDYYLYKGDYFQMIANSTANIFYQVSSEDLEYVDITENDARATIKEGKDGIYKISFDLTSKTFDLEYKKAIEIPVYEKMNGCDVYSLKSEFSPMTENPNNSDELMILNYEIESGALISFYNHGDIHLSNYKVHLDNEVMGKYADALETGDKHVTFAIGGIYNLYINPNTYFLRVELVNKDTADYSLQYFNKDGTCTTVTANDSNKPYLFNYQKEVTIKERLPIYASSCYMMYDLTINASEYINDMGAFNIDGLFDIGIYLKSFEITVSYIPQ